MASSANRFRGMMRASALMVSVLAVILLLSHFTLGEAPRSGRDRRMVQDNGRKKPLGRVREIIIIGNTITPQSVILRAFPFKSGDKFTLTDLRAAERNLARLNLFMANPAPRVMVMERDGEDSPYKDIRIDVTEKPGNDLFWCLEENLEFAAVWYSRGLGAACRKDAGFPVEMIGFSLTGNRKALPWVIERMLPEREGCTGYIPSPAVVP